MTGSEQPVVESLVQLQGRLVLAAGQLEVRLHALELVVAVGEPRFLGPALDQVQEASDTLACLELSRGLILSAAGLSPDIPAAELLAHPWVHVATEASLRAGLVELDAAMQRVAAARSRTDDEIRAALTTTSQRRGSVL